MQSTGGRMKGTDPIDIEPQVDTGGMWLSWRHSLVIMNRLGMVGDGWGNKTKKTEVDLNDAQTWKSHEPRI